MKSSVRSRRQVERDTGGADVAFTEVRGDVTITGAGGPGGAFLQVATIRGNATLNDSYLVTVLSSTIGVNLSCMGNSAGTNRGSVNTVGGQRLGDCQNV